MKFTVPTQITELPHVVRVCVLRGAEALELPPEEVYLELKQYFVPQKRVWGWKEIANICGVSVSTVRRWYYTNPNFRKLIHHHNRRVWAYSEEVRKLQFK